MTISVQRGYDVTDYVLNSFGGAGGQHACLVADAIGIGRVLIHPLSGVLSAYGMGLAELKATRSRAVLRPLDANGLAAAEAWRHRSSKMRRRNSPAREFVRAGIRMNVQLHLRYLGTDSALPVSLGTLADLKSAFEATHRQRFGFISPDKAIEIEAIEVEALGGGGHPLEPDLPPRLTAARRCKSPRNFTPKALVRGAGVLAGKPEAGLSHQGTGDHH